MVNERSYWLHTLNPPLLQQFFWTRGVISFKRLVNPRVGGQIIHGEIWREARYTFGPDYCTAQFCDGRIIVAQHIDDSVQSVA